MYRRKNSRWQHTTESLLPDHPVAMAITKNGLLLPIDSPFHQLQPTFSNHRHTVSTQYTNSSYTDSDSLSTSEISSSTGRRCHSKRRSYLEKLRKFLGHKFKHSKTCYQANSPNISLIKPSTSTICSSNSSVSSFEYDNAHNDDDHDKKCNCHEFYAELEQALAHSKDFARSRAMAGDFNSRTGTDRYETQTFNSMTPPKYGLSRPQYNKWQKRNSHVSFDFGLPSNDNDNLLDWTDGYYEGHYSCL